MPDLTPLPARSRRFCDCGRLASYILTVKVGWPAKPVQIALCTTCAALEARTTPARVLEFASGITQPALCQPGNRQPTDAIRRASR